MKGRNYLLITSILIIAGAVAGLALNIGSTILQESLRVPGMIICTLFLITGILGLKNRSRSSFICTLFGIIMSFVSIITIPFMFWIGHGTAPIWVILSGLVYFIILGLYLKGVYLNKRSARREKYWYAASYR